MKVKKFEAVAKIALTAMEEPNANAEGVDVATATSGGTPLTFGLFRMNSGEPFPYDYSFDEFKYVMEGEITVTDGDGAVSTFSAGDVMQFSKDTKAFFSTESTALMLYVASR